MGDEMNLFTSKGVLICKKTGEMKDLGEVTIKEACLGELEPGDERIELKTPSFFGGEQETITFTVKVRSKRKWRKLMYKLNPKIPMNRKYLSKRDVICAIHKISELMDLGQLTETDEQLMHHSSKHLHNVFNYLCDKYEGR